MNQEQHNKERKEDKAATDKVASVHNFDFTIIKWFLGIIGTICAIFVAVFGWSLNKIYDVGSVVSAHTAILEGLQSGQTNIEVQVSAIYQYELNKTDQAFYLPTRIATSSAEIKL